MPKTNLKQYFRQERYFAMISYALQGVITTIQAIARLPASAFVNSACFVYPHGTKLLQAADSR